MIYKTMIKRSLEAYNVLVIAVTNLIIQIRFLCNYNSTKQNIIEYQMLLAIHSIEKGLCIKDVRLGFGKEKIRYLIKLLNIYDYNKYDTSSHAYKTGIGIINSYIEFHQKYNYSLQSLQRDFSSIKIKLDSFKNDIDLAGIELFSKTDLSQGKNFDFYKFVNTRHSIRNFSDEEVNEDIIIKAIKIAQQAPSACNRQPNKIYYSMSLKFNIIIDDLVPGNQGFQGKVNKYIVVTCDIEAFGTLEINQWYINGGIYCAYLLLAFHSLGIGACSFQWPSIKRKSKKLRKLASIPNNEEIILIIGIGHYDNTTNIPFALRKNVDDVRRVF